MVGDFQGIFYRQDAKIAKVRKRKENWFSQAESST
jgi:hypothetical protein